MNRSIIFALLLFAFASPAIAEDAQRPSTWAVPVAGDVVKNFYRLDDKVYRSAQPDDEDMVALETFGIREVLNLRYFHTDDSEARSTGLKLHRVPMNASEIKDEDVIAALKYIRDAKGPIVIHCWHGSDRTGTIAAMYRIVFQGWSKEAAIEELEKGDYGYHATVYPNIPEYIRGADVPMIRKRLKRSE